MMHVLRCGTAFSCLAILIGGCGLDELFVSVGDDKPTVSVPSPDGGDEPDASGSKSDGSMDPADGSMGDGVDGSTTDGGENPLDPFDWSTCAPSDEVIGKIEVPFAEASEQALVPGLEGFGIAYRTKNGCDQIEAAALTAFGPLPAGSAVLGTGECFAYRDLSLLRGDDHWLLAWVDNSTGKAELHAQHFDEQLAPLSGALQVTEGAALPRRPNLAHLGATPVVAFISQSEAGRSIQTRRLDTNASASTVLDNGAGHLPEQLAFAPLGLTGAALAWVNAGGVGGVHLQPLTQIGTALGSPVRLSAYDGAAATVDIAQQTRGADALRGGAVVYSVQVSSGTSEVRFRRLSESGQPMADERVIVPSPLRARDASITAVGDGYAIAYRAMPDGNLVRAAEIRLLFVTREGNLARDIAGRPITYKVADATASSGRVTLRLSVEGQLLLSWLDKDPMTGNKYLKHVRRPLNCR